jgi:hypothetical protein
MEEGFTARMRALLNLPGLIFAVIVAGGNIHTYTLAAVTWGNAIGFTAIIYGILTLQEKRFSRKKRRNESE